MLHLTRKIGERIMIDDNITITVVDIDSGRCRLGIEAPRDVAVYRSELLACPQCGGDRLPGETCPKCGQP